MTYYLRLHQEGNCGGSSLTCSYCKSEEERDPIESPFCIYGCTDYHVDDCPILRAPIELDRDIESYDW